MAERHHKSEPATAQARKSMNITFTPEPTPKLTLSGKLLVALGFITGTPLQLTVTFR